MATENERNGTYNLDGEPPIDLCFSEIVLNQDVNYTPEALIDFIKKTMFGFNQEFLLKLRISLHETYKHYFEEDEEFEEDNGYSGLGIKVFRIIKRKIPPKISESIDEGEYLGFITVTPKNQFSTSVEIESPPGERYDFMKLLAREIAGDSYKDPHQIAPDNRPGDQQPATDKTPGLSDQEISNDQESGEFDKNVLSVIYDYTDPYNKETWTNKMEHFAKKLHISRTSFGKLLQRAAVAGWVFQTQKLGRYRATNHLKAKVNSLRQTGT